MDGQRWAKRTTSSLEKWANAASGATAVQPLFRQKLNKCSSGRSVKIKVFQKIQKLIFLRLYMNRGYCAKRWKFFNQKWASDAVGANLFNKKSKRLSRHPSCFTFTEVKKAKVLQTVRPVNFHGVKQAKVFQTSLRVPLSNFSYQASAVLPRIRI